MSFLYWQMAVQFDFSNINIPRCRHILIHGFSTR